MRKAKPPGVYCCNQQHTHSRPWIRCGVLITHLNHLSWQKTTCEGKTPQIPQQFHSNSTARHSWIQAGIRPNLPGIGAAAATAGAIPGKLSPEPRAPSQGQSWPAGPHSCQEKALPCPTHTREPPWAAPCLSTHRVTHGQRDAFITDRARSERVSSARGWQPLPSWPGVATRAIAQKTWLRRRRKPDFNPLQLTCPNPASIFRSS